jgi:hypothetical protein
VLLVRQALRAQRRNSFETLTSWSESLRFRFVIFFAPRCPFSCAVPHSWVKALNGTDGQNFSTALRAPAQKEGIMKRTLIYAIAACFFAIATAANPPKAHAAVETYLSTDAGSGESSSSSSGYTVSSWLITVCDALGIR